ncbi:MAG: hypothetical protein CMJ28_02325 [Phycisphaerae bacterium]|nr:hypothetical protein [Phycisphaerae bacterium]
MQQKKSQILSLYLQIYLRLKHCLKLRMQSMAKCLSTFFDVSTDLKAPNETYVVLERRIWAVLLLFALCITAFLLGSCSASTEIAKASTVIGDKAASSKNRFALIEQEAEASSPDLVLIKSEAVGGQKEQDVILNYSSDIQHLLPSVEDQTPYWLNVVEYGLIVLGLLGTCWLLWYTGVGALIKGLIGFIPRAKRREANLASEALDERSPVTVRELVAAKRASDPEFDRAYERSRTERDRAVRSNERPSAGM